jgi:hypothetical protein
MIMLEIVNPNANRIIYPRILQTSQPAPAHPAGKHGPPPHAHRAGVIRAPGEHVMGM